MAYGNLKGVVYQAVMQCCVAGGNMGFNIIQLSVVNTLSLCD